MGRVFRGAVVRACYALCIVLLTTLIVVMYEGGFKGSGLWGFTVGILFLIIECVVTNKMTQGFDWKWFNPATVIFAGNGLAAIWFLQMRTISYSDEGLYACTNYTAEQELQRLDLSLAADWLDFCMCGHCNGAAEQLFVIMLMIGRYFIPKGVSFYHPEHDNINTFLKSIARTHFFLVVTCNGADALDMISYSRFPTLQGNTFVINVLVIVFCFGIAQFCVDTLATTEAKKSDIHILVETDLWSSLLIIMTDDVPFLAMRLFLMTNYQVFSSMGVFFFFKNFVCICVALHKGVIIWLGKDMEEIEEYVISEPYTPEPRRRALSRMDTPNSLNDLSETGSTYTFAQAVKSRAERKPSDWGDESEWYGESRDDIDKIMSETQGLEKPEVKSNGGSQFIGSSDWDVEAGLKEGTTMEKSALADQRLNIWNPYVDPAYFTEGYANQLDAMIDASKTKSRRYIEVPLGTTSIRGPINFSFALPKPEPREIESAKPEKEKKHKKSSKEAEDEWATDSIKRRPKSNTADMDDTIDDIINTVDDDEPRKEKKKKKKKDKEQDREVEDDATDAGVDKSEERKHKKKKSKSDEHDAEEDEARRERRKKKKKNKDKDRDKD